MLIGFASESDCPRRHWLVFVVDRPIAEPKSLLIHLQLVTPLIDEHRVTSLVLPCCHRYVAIKMAKRMHPMAIRFGLQ